MDSLKPNEREEDRFLANFVRGEIKRPPDGLNGDCIIHYIDEYDEYEMRVRLVNGKREGKAVILENDIPFLILNYRDGQLNGEVFRMDGVGGIQMKGTLVNGREIGLFKEYSDGILIWIGYYRDGERYSVLRKSIHMNGYYEERSVKSNELLSIAEYDPELNEKNGYCIECNNGKLQEWMYERGVKKPVVPDVDNGIEIPLKGTEETNRKRDRPEEQSNDVPKRIRLSPSLPENKDDSLILYDMETGCEYGVIQLNNRCYEVRRSEYEKQVIEVDLNSHEIRVYKNGKWIEYTKEEGCIDLDSNGRRWEGGMKDGKPFGYGVLYDEEGRKEYEGIMVDGVKVCYGKEYYSDIEKVRYEGCYYEGKHFGKGVLYDRNGMVEYGGLWEHDKPYSDQHDNNTIDCTTESVDISDNSFNEVIAFILPFLLCSLKRIVIGDNCFGKVRVVELDGLGELESVVIGQDSFTNTKYADYVWNEIPAEGSFRIQNCPRLKSIQIGVYSFADYHVFSLTGLIDGLV